MKIKKGFVLRQVCGENVVVGEGHPRTRGRFDQWQIKIGMYLWQSK